jgi:hypothetical protein
VSVAQRTQQRAAASSPTRDSCSRSSRTV